MIKLKETEYLKFEVGDIRTARTNCISDSRLCQNGKLAIIGASFLSFDLEGWALECAL